MRRPGDLAGIVARVAGASVVLLTSSTLLGAPPDQAGPAGPSATEPAGAPPPLVDVQRPDDGGEPSRSVPAPTAAPAAPPPDVEEPPPPAPPPRPPAFPDGTPRTGTVSGYFFGIAGGLAALKSAAAERVPAGAGGAIALQLGIAFVDRIPLGVSFGGVFLEDKQPFAEYVSSCTTVGGTPVSCSDPEKRKSQINGSFLGFESGYQQRFRPGKKVSLLPQALIGYLVAPGGLNRGVGCDGCTSISIHGVNPGGLYVAPSFKVTFGEDGFFAVAVRSEWFLTGDLQHRTLLGLEIGAP